MLVRSIVVCMLSLLLSRSVAADDSEASRLFVTGVSHAERSEWPEAVAAFEAALAREDRASVRFNLVMAYQALGKPLETLRHGLVFLELPTAPHREEARAQVGSVVERARTQVACIQRASLPLHGELHIEDQTGAAVRDEHCVYVQAGRTQLTLRISDHPDLPQPRTLLLAAGEERPWPPTASIDSAQAGRLPESLLAQQLDAPETSRLEGEFAASSEISPNNLRWRKRVAWSLGVTGALSLSVSAFALARAQRAAHHFVNSDPYIERSPLMAYAAQVQNWSNAVVAPSLLGAALVVAGIVAGERSTQQRSSAWAWAALSVGVAGLATGVGLMVATPDSLNGSDYREPTRHAGCLLTSAALPLLGYAITYAVRRHRQDRPRALAFQRTSRGQP